jgi:hypothetical protein
MNSQRLLTFFIGLLFGIVAWMIFFAYQSTPPIGWVDPALYIYWFLGSEDTLQHRTLEYHGTRYPFVLAGAFLYRHFGIITGQSLLAYGQYFFGLFATYFLASTVARRQTTRLLLWAIVAINPLWIATYFRGYVDGLCISFGLLTFAFSAAAAQKAGISRYILFFAAGSSAAAAFLTHPFGGGLAALAAAIALIITLRSLGKVLLAGLMAMIGALATTGGLIAFGWLIGLPTETIVGFLLTLKAAISNASTKFEVPSYEWIFNTFRILLCTTSIMLIVLMAIFRSRSQSSTVLYSASFVVLLVVTYYVTKSSFIIQFNFYASYWFLALVPLVILVLALLEKYTDEIQMKWILAVTLMFDIGITLAGQQFSFSSRLAGGYERPVWFLLIGLLIAALGMLMMRRYGATLVLATISLSGAGAANLDTATVFRLADGPNNAAQQHLLEIFRGYLDTYHVTQSAYLVWFSRTAFVADAKIGDQNQYTIVFSGTTLKLNALDSLSGSLGWDQTYLGDAMPTVDQAETSRLAQVPLPGTFLVTLCTRTTGCAEGVLALTRLGHELQLIDEKQLSVPDAPSIHVRIDRFK